MLKSLRLGIAAAVLLAVWTGVQAGADKDAGHDSDKNHVALRPDDLKWGPAPPGLPAGAEFALLTGDPHKAGPYVIRAKLPDGYKVPPHWHSSDENVTVIAGTLMIGKGETIDADSCKALPVGSFMRMPKKMRHFAWAKGQTIIQVHGMGPFDINYVNATDDPRKN